MKVMILGKATRDTEAEVMPSQELIAAMHNYNEALIAAGILKDQILGGLRPSRFAKRVHFSGKDRTVIDGPFAETKELIAGYWIINVKSKQEAIDWAKRVPNPHGPGQEGEIEIRQFFELEDFAPSPAVDRHATLGKELAKSKKQAQ
jgi:hypothetical protein